MTAIHLTGNHVNSLNINTLDASNQALAAQIRAELSQGRKPNFDIPGTPRDYFKSSPFWDYSPEGAMLDWHYLLSRLRSKEEIIPGVFIGTEPDALLGELVRGDYDCASNDAASHLVFENEEVERDWPATREMALGKQQEKVPFTRVITVTKDASDEALLRHKLQSVNPGCGYLDVKTHEIIQLRDLPQNQLEVQDQRNQWRNLENRFKALFKLIDAARLEGEPILIHCKAGRHRSAATLAAYLIDRLGLSAKGAIDYIRTKRGCAIHYELSEFSAWLSLREQNRV